MPAHLMRDDAEQMQRIGVVWRHREDLPVDRLGVRKAPGLMVSQCEFECLLNVHDGEGDG
jgi:hypothetical protein